MYDRGSKGNHFNYLACQFSVISLSLRLPLITPTLTLIILDITKTSYNNCLKALKISYFNGTFHR